MKTKVIAICGSSSGVGKSTLVNQLVKALPNSECLYFDSYQKTTIYPPNLFEDLIAGKAIDPSDIKNDLFYRDLTSLIKGKEIVDPYNRKVHPSKYLIIEEPFGRLRNGMRDIIDYLIGIEVPLDIALARRILRNINNDFPGLNSEEKLDFLNTSLTEYLNGGRIAYQVLFEEIRKDCNLLLNGLCSKDEMLNEVMKIINRQT